MASAAGIALAVWFSTAATSPAGEFGNRHAILFGLDGIRADALKTCVENGTAPNIAGLIQNGTVTWTAHAGGEPGTPTEQITVSGPGWSSVLTGVWKNKHGVADNSFKGSNYTQFPNFFVRLHESHPNARLVSLVSWPPINQHIVPASPEDGPTAIVRHTWPHDLGVEKKLVEEAIREVSTENPDVVFCYQGDTDIAGHAHGFSTEVPEYMEAIATADARIGEVLTAVRGRENFAQEDWLFVVATDHGGKGTRHGGQTPEERTIPLIVSGGTTGKGIVSEETPGHTSVPATILRHLAVAVDPAWGWESAPFPAAEK